jgi:DNA-3-methyladenine glycosylase II
VVEGQLERNNCWIECISNIVTESRAVALDIRRARRHFAGIDPEMHALVQRVGPCRLDARVAPDAFRALVRAIAAQQVSAKAARTVYDRLTALAPGGHLTAHALLAHDAEALRATGLGPAKTRSVRDLAEHVADGRLDLEALTAEDDASVIRALTAVRGIGTWTAEVFLIFQLQRLDVFPAADLALLTAIQRVYGKRARPTPHEGRRFAERWRPYRSIASWYLWRSIEP